MLFQRALRIHEQALGPEHPDTSKVREDYTNLLQTLEEKARITHLPDNITGSGSPHSDLPGSAISLNKA